MSNANQDKIFAGSVPKLYEDYLVPMLFEPYAVDMAKRVAALRPARVLELAAGTGVVTRHLAADLPAATAIVATDLSQGMLDQAAAAGTSRPVERRQADAMQLPFADGEFDVIVCQFGVMFFPDKAKSFAETRRVLKPGGAYLFNVWGSLQENDFADIVTAAMAAVFPDDPPRFLPRTPYGYFDFTAIQRDLAGGGFQQPARIETVTARSRAASALAAAMGYCQGTPLRGEIEARGPDRLAPATEAAAEAIARRFGRGAVDGRIQAHVVTVTR